MLIIHLVRVFEGERHLFLHCLLHAPQCFQPQQISHEWKTYILHFENNPLHSITVVFSSKDQNVLMVFLLINSVAAHRRVQYAVQCEYFLHVQTFECTGGKLLRGASCNINFPSNVTDEISLSTNRRRGDPVKPEACP